MPAPAMIEDSAFRERLLRAPKKTERQESAKESKRSTKRSSCRNDLRRNNTGADCQPGTLRKLAVKVTQLYLGIEPSRSSRDDISARELRESRLMNLSVQFFLLPFN